MIAMFAYMLIGTGAVSLWTGLCFLGAEVAVHREQYQ